MEDELRTTWSTLHWLLFVFLVAVSVFAMGVWVTWVLQPASDPSVFHKMGLALTSLFVLLHLPSIAAGVILWRAKGAAGWRDWFIKGATVYFVAMTVFSFTGVFTMASMVNGM